MEVGKIYHGFLVKEKTYVEDVHSDCYLMEHSKSGARLLYLQNSDDNKVFSIGFRTPSRDDTGVAHILEHSSLCGSRKYHLKEPFIELAKGSLNTFLNAMTYPDKTVYPVASRNDKDFANLMDVYLDAVFYPLIYDNPYTLWQEGWHYEINSKDDVLQYNGVVYNEMKGVYSSPDAYLEREAMLALFPDSSYRFDSGGYPEAIPSLTEKKFLDFHKTLYSPENSYIYLYGDMDIDATLEHISEEYLNNFEKTGKIKSEIELQAPLTKTQEIEAFYPVDKDSDLTAKTYHELSIVTGHRVQDDLTCSALRLLESVLLENESGPLRRALIEAKVGQFISGSFVSSLLQPIFSIKVSGSEKEQKDKFLSVVYRELQRLMVEGIDRELLEAALNAMDFRLREADFGNYPKGLIYGLNVMETWIYDGNPINVLRYKKKMQTLRQGLKSRFYEEVIEQFLLDNSHRVLVTLMPKQGKQAEDVHAETLKLTEIKKSMDKATLESYVEQCKELHRRQGAEDRPEDLAAIPILRREDIRREIDDLPIKTEKCGENTLAYVPLETNGITYLDWCFDITGVEEKYLPYITLFTDVFAKLNTEKYTYKDLAVLEGKYTGGIGLGFNCLSKYKDGANYSIKISLKAKVLQENEDKLYDLLEQIVHKTKYTDVNRLREIVEEIKTDMDDSFFSNGMNIALHRLQSYTSAAARVNEYHEFNYILFIKDLYADFDKRGKETLKILQYVAKQCYNRQGALLVYACDKENQVTVKDKAEKFLDTMNESAWANKPPQKIPIIKTNEAITTSGKVQYVIAGGNFVKHGFEFTGAMLVLTTILSYEYLWTKIRVQGGAYGSSVQFTPNGFLAFSSYRDPQLAQSLSAYKEMPDWLRNKKFSDREMDKYVIGTISHMDKPLTNAMKVSKAVLKLVKGITDKELQKERDEVLQVTEKDLHKLADVVEITMKDNLVCVVGGKEAIEQNKSIFNEIINM